MLCGYSTSKFAEDVRALSLGEEYRTNVADTHLITDAKAFTCFVVSTPKPPLIPYDDFSAIGGPSGYSDG